MNIALCSYIFLGIFFFFSKVTYQVMFTRYWTLKKYLSIVDQVYGLVNCALWLDESPVSIKEATYAVNLRYYPDDAFFEGYFQASFKLMYIRFNYQNASLPQL